MSIKSYGLFNYRYKCFILSSDIFTFAFGIWLTLYAKLVIVFQPLLLCIPSITILDRKLGKFDQMYFIILDKCSFLTLFTNIYNTVSDWRQTRESGHWLVPLPYEFKASLAAVRGSMDKRIEEVRDNIVRTAENNSP